MTETGAPLIGLLCRNDRSVNYEQSPVYAQGVHYVRAIVQAGGVPFLIPLNLPESSLRYLYALAAGVLLTGGGDVEPSLYNAGPHPTLWDVQPDRDRDEIMVARWAAADAKPLMGICRGIQVIAVATGGSLIQDIPSQVQDAVPHRQPGEPGRKRSESQLVHAVALTPASRLARIVGADTIWVNSSHHQAVEAVPAPWEVTGRSSDGVIEAIEHRDHPFQVGVEWHPEALTDGQEWAARIFATFVQACRDAGTTASAGCGAPSPHRPAR